MASSKRKGKTIHNEAREKINRVNHEVNKKQGRRVRFCLSAVQIEEQRTVEGHRLQH
jgi:hypothetical protein